MRALAVSGMALLLFGSTAWAGTSDPWLAAFSPRADHDPWRIDWHATSAAAPAMPLSAESEQPLHAAAVAHSDAYRTRAKIHKYTSFATLPLFATELALGQSLYNTPANAGGKRAAHAAVGAGIIGLCGVGTVTGAWNLFGEGRRDKDGHTLRLVHGLLMMAADAGFLATWAAGPNSNSQHEAPTFESDKATHRNLAIASISVGTAGYLLMLFGNR
jgi:hypothetical protein